MNTLQRTQLADQQVSFIFQTQPVHTFNRHFHSVAVLTLESCIFYKSPYPKKCVIIVVVFIMSLLLQKYKMYSRHLK